MSAKKRAKSIMRRAADPVLRRVEGVVEQTNARTVIPRLDVVEPTAASAADGVAGLRTEVDTLRSQLETMRVEVNTLQSYASVLLNSIGSYNAAARDAARRIGRLEEASGVAEPGAAGPVDSDALRALLDEAGITEPLDRE